MRITISQSKFMKMRRSLPLLFFISLFLGSYSKCVQKALMSSPSTTPLYPIAQWITLAWTPRVSAALSILGSATIIMMIVRGGKEKLGRLHNRLFLGMSSIDILNSVALGASTAPFPRELNDIFYGAIGNKATCTLQGFFAALGGGEHIFEYYKMCCV